MLIETAKSSGTWKAGASQEDPLDRTNLATLRRLRDIL